MSFTEQVVLPKLQCCRPLVHQLVLLWLVVCAQLAFASAAHAQRVALLIGNSSYQSAPLTNPPNDVQVMDAALKRVGFKVQKVLNANQNQMKRAVRDFGEAAQGAEVALLYYSGHGTQASGENYLLPVGAVINKESDYEVEAVAANALMRQIAGARPKAAIVVLEACRDNPYARTTKSTNKGLARMEAPTGTMIAFATSPGTTAGDEGYYAKVLAEQITIPGQELIQVFRNTGNQVRKLSRGKQEPRISEVSINDEVYLAGHRQVASLQPEPVALQIARPVPAQTNSPSSGQTFRDCPERDCPECPEMVVIPEGSFIMGSDVWARDSEKPMHSVAVRKFAIGKTEVTQGEWMAVMGSKPSKHQSCGVNCPVEQVSWDDIQQFVEKLNLKTGKTYRLPSEAEWEYVAKAGSTNKWSFGNDAMELGEHAWYDRNSDNKPHPVAEKLPNIFGLQDLYGNVREWVQDCWHKSYIDAPMFSDPWIDGCDNLNRVSRGGHWNDYYSDLRSSSRSWQPADSRFSILGFRLAKTIVDR